MVQAKRVTNIVYILIILLSLTATGGEYAVAQESVESTRQTTVIIEETLFEWWLLRWTDNILVCQIFVDHEGPPTAEEVVRDCGQDIYKQWLITPPCEEAASGKPTTYCPGLYAYFAGFNPGTITTVVELPTPSVWIDVSGCSLNPPENFCSQQPKLAFNAEEPLPDQEIEAIHVVVEGIKVSCPGEKCEVPVKSTPLSGTEVEFWADSTFGDSSEHYTALVRVVETGVSTNPGVDGWYVDVLSSQWLGGPVESCSLNLGFIPTTGITSFMAFNSLPGPASRFSRALPIPGWKIDNPGIGRCQ